MDNSHMEAMLQARLSEKQYCKELGCRKEGLEEYNGYCKEHKVKGEIENG